MVDVKFVQKFSNLISLEMLREIEGLQQMAVLKKGSRLSIQPVRENEYNLIMRTYGY